MEDQQIYIEVYNLSDCRLFSLIPRQIDLWCKHNKLTLNAQKCEVVSYTPRKQAILGEYVISDATTVNFCGLGSDFRQTVVNYLLHIEKKCLPSMKL